LLLPWSVMWAWGLANARTMPIKQSKDLI